MEIPKSDIAVEFDYAIDSKEKAAVVGHMRRVFSMLVSDLKDSVSAGRYRAIAVSKLEDAELHVMKALSFEQPTVTLTKGD